MRPEVARRRGASIKFGQRREVCGFVPLRQGLGKPSLSGSHSLLLSDSDRDSSEGGLPIYPIKVPIPLIDLRKVPKVTPCKGWVQVPLQG
jgi:hypothetical protein